MEQRPTDISEVHIKSTGKTPSDLPDNILMTTRGFKHGVAITSLYGGDIKTYESSLASEPCVWISVSSPTDFNDPSGHQQVAFAHLRLEDAIAFRDQLTYLISHHYQLED